jgi:arylformamidase
MSTASERRIYDLSPRIEPGFPVWPGDTPFSSRLIQSLAEGASVNLSALTTTPHLGSHADAPFHSEPDGVSIADLPLAPYLGPCRVVEVPPEPLIEPRHLGEIALGELGDPPRLLLKTGSMPPLAAGAPFPERFSALSPELARLLGERGVLLVGLDTPSVDPFDSKTLDAHHALAAGGVVNLEGLDLSRVPPGIYELIALPLNLAGLDASPVRAVLREVG